MLVVCYECDGVQAIREGADAVIAVGGDGTLHEVQLPISWNRNIALLHMLG